MAKKTTPKGPALTWNRDRDIALVRAVADGIINSDDLVAVLSADEAFSSVVDAITADKIRLRLGRLRKEGVNLPKVRRAYYTPDTDHLNSLLGS